MQLNNDRPEAGLLKRALRLNAGFSGLSGLVIVLFDTPIAALLGVPELVLWPVGAILIGFSAWLWWLASRSRIEVFDIQSVIASDFAWVAGTVILLIGWHGALTPAGLAVLAAVGVVVFIFAELQWIGLRRLRHPE